MYRSKFSRALTVAGVTAALLVGLTAPAGAVTLDEVSGNGHGTIFRAAGSNFGVPLLARFQYHFTGGDHHIRQVSAMPLPQQIAVEVAFADENGDDDYGYRVSAEHVDATGVVQASFHGTCVGQCSVFLFTRPAADVVFVLQGFRVTFDNGDHHLDKIGVQEDNGVLTTAFRDNNGDDPFTYDVSYAWVPRSRFSTLTESSSVVHASGLATPAAVAGEKVVRGFSMDNVNTGDSGDNHIRDLGVVANFDNFEIRYGDDNPRDSADWSYSVRYGVLV
ncbi:hypothetical protein ACWEIJ_38075 [Lentzea sp. NPDC004789]